MPHIMQEIKIDSEPYNVPKDPLPRDLRSDFEKSLDGTQEIVTLKLADIPKSYVTP